MGLGKFYPIILISTLILGIIILGILLFSFYKKIKEQYDIYYQRKKEKELLEMDFKQESIFSINKSLRQCVAPDGVSANQPNYIILNDTGKDIYVRTLGVIALPKQAYFAKTFKPVLDYHNSTTSIFVEPVKKEDAGKQIDNEIRLIEIEEETAENNARRRSLRNQKAERNQWANDNDKDLIRFFHVGILITIHADTLKELDANTWDLVQKGKKEGIILTTCWGMQSEAFISNAPLGKIQYVNSGIKSIPPFVEKFLMTHDSLSTIYNYTSKKFTLSEGTLLGEDLFTHQVKRIKLFDPTRNGYNIVIAGTTSVGKSSLCKSLLVKDSIENNTRYIFLDRQRPAGQTEGEYTHFVRSLNGTIYKFDDEAGNILNPFEVSEEYCVVKDGDEIIGEEPTLKLKERISITSEILSIMVFNNDESLKKDWIDVSNINSLITKIVAELYEDKDIFHGVPESLFEDVDTPNGKIQVRKDLPTLSDFYKKLVYKQYFEPAEEFKNIYSIVRNAIEPYIRELYYLKDTYEFITKEEANRPENRNKVVIVKGIKTYYDGQSTIQYNKNMRAMSYDLSGLSEKEQNIANLIAMFHSNELYVKKNSENPTKMQPLCIVYDEAHISLKDPKCAAMIELQARIVRKKNCMIILLLQAIGDLEEKKCKNGDAIIKNIGLFILFKQSKIDADFIRKNITVTEAELQQIFELGGSIDENNKVARKGEFYITDTYSGTFVKGAYMPKVEARIVETDPEKIRQMYS